jgi:histidyl-tRNA synthetase
LHSSAVRNACSGFALGIERLLLLREQNNVKAAAQKPDVFIVGDASAGALQKLAMELRKKDLQVITDLQKRSFKAQMKESIRLVPILL